MSHTKLFIIAGAIAVVIVGVFYFDSLNNRSGCSGRKDIGSKCGDSQLWETYRNEEFEFEVKYPNDVLVSESDNLVFFGLDDNTPLNLSVNFAVSQEPTLASLERRKIDPRGNMQEKENIEFHGQPAVKVVERFEGPETMSAYIEAIGFLYGQAEYVIHITGTHEPSASQRKRIDEILSTFKFIDSTDTSDWKTYRNEEYGYEFKYPSSWARLEERNPIFNDHLPDSRRYLAIYPESFPSQDISAHIDVYRAPFTAVKLDNHELVYTLPPSEVTTNGVVWLKFQSTDNLGNELNTFTYYTERGGKTYHVGGAGEQVHQILSTFRFFETGNNNVFDVTAVKTGDKIVGLEARTVAPFSVVPDFPLGPDNARVVFFGTVILEGEYRALTGELLGGYLCFAPSATSQAHIPVMRGDGRDISFCFSDQDVAHSLLNAERGRVTIEVEDYVINSYPAEVFNEAELRRVLIKDFSGE